MTGIKAYFQRVRKRLDIRWISVLLLFVLFSASVYSAITPMDGETELYRDVIRFHVLANSDSDDDQALKLLVRDRVTMFTTELLKDTKTVSEAKALLSENSDRITEIAEEVIRENGYSYGASTVTGYEIYPERQYGKYRFPAGKYCSLRVKIGRAEGKNWWCVLFPPMCLASSTVQKYENEGELARLGFSDGEIGVIDEQKSIRKEIRFFFLDKIYKRK
ncbi:MAG: stage II sporulation protein R [Clostridia bacterium]|nr:stage II sporulation protein R [Clostridia bacterium]